MIHDHKSASEGLSLLCELEEVLNAADLWSCDQPSPAALASQQPFACDTLTFEQWLQFIFLPRLTVLLKSGETVPTMALLPMAEETWQGAQQPVLRVLARVDNWSQTHYG